MHGVRRRMTVERDKHAANTDTRAGGRIQMGSFRVRRSEVQEEADGAG